MRRPELLSPRDLRGLRYLLRMTMRSSPHLATVFLLLTAALAGGTAAIALTSKLTVDRVFSGAHGGALGWAIATGFAVSMFFVIQLRYADVLFTLLERTRAQIERELMDAVGNTRTTSAFDDEHAMNQLDRVRQGSDLLAEALNTASGVAREVTSLVITGVVLITVQPWLALLFLVAFISFRLNRTAAKIDMDAREAYVETDRMSEQFFDLLTSMSTAKELRVFGTGPALLDRLDKLTRHSNDGYVRAKWKSTGLLVVNALLYSSAYAFAVVLVLIRALHHEASPGDVVLVIGLAGGITGAIGGIAAYGGGLVRVLDVSRRMTWLQEYALRDHSNAVSLRSAPRELTQGVELRNVTVKYPGAAEASLRSVSLRIDPGTTVGLVGLNGSGKSTLVKVLLGFITPDTGSVLVDGVTLEEIDLVSWRAGVAAVYQDHFQFELRLEQAVAAGCNTACDAPPERVTGALDLSGGAGIVAKLPSGVRTQLGSRWRAGVDLSTGEWQKVALARSTVREGPLLRVMDEPAGSLDVDTESLLFRRFWSARSSVVGGGGPIMLLVSHTLASVKMCDTVIVLEQGEVVEAGPPEILYSKGGRYRELYDLQAGGYLDDAPIRLDSEALGHADDD